VRVGGLTSSAYLFGAELNRESTRRDQDARLKQAVDQLEQDLQRAGIVRAQSAVTPDDGTSLKAETEAQRALIARLRTLKPNGRIVLELRGSPSVADLPDIALEDADRFFVPARPSQVSVFGTVFNESSFLYRPEKTVFDYLAQAGGPRKEADTSSTYVLRADGSVVSRRQSGIFAGSLTGLQVMPGDAIVVPEDFTRTTWTKHLKDWTQILYQFGLGAAALKVLRD
jgi:polysaccharide biosynthesis/export protein